ncbi:MAG: replicative DNA helicase [Phycisphaerales bacterium]
MVGIGDKENQRKWHARSDRPAIDLEKLFDQVVPHSFESEMALLGAIILDPRVMNDCVMLLPNESSFYNEAHATIYKALLTLYEQSNTGDLVLLQALLKDRQELEEVGGAQYLVALAQGVPSAANAIHYARIIREKAQLRNLIEAAGQSIYDAYHSYELGDDATQKVIDAAEERIFQIVDRFESLSVGKLAELLHEVMNTLRDNEGRTITGIASGFYDLDEMLSGLQPGELLIVAARPSMGKTAFALNLAEQIALAGSPHAKDGPETPVAFFSMEMSRQSIVQRLLCAKSGVDSHRFRRNMLSQQEFAALAHACGDLERAPIIIDDTPGLTVMQLRAKARRMVAQHGCRCIVVDYLQLMTAPGSARDGRQNEVSAISRGVKAIARELNVPVVCLAQLNRGAEQREGHRPRMADLRESGSIEQDADVIMLLHREEYYHTQDPDWAAENPDRIGVAEVIVAKQRNGPTGVVELSWTASTTRFGNLARRRGGDDYAPASAHRAGRDGGSMAPAGRIGAGGRAGGGVGGAMGGGEGPPPFEPGSGAVAGGGGGGGSSFGNRPRTGPVENFRDGGGDEDYRQSDGFDDEDDGMDDLPM